MKTEREVLENNETGELLSASAVTIERRGLDPWTLHYMP
jgi:hypothetical protein